uniref:Phosphatidylinositol-glycan-specific phospholipase D n=1 Tax=Saccoglossus kowalevskii TaxID=10224 RepID=A0ABM0MXM4_SACKO|nr:PREDICTED: phosphatidylinositol-glycan-specific phospholipase D-like [Saccoglossus kowalevskii]
MSYRFLLTSFMNVVTLFITLCTVGHDCCGGITHTEIAHRAASFFQHHSDGTDYRQVCYIHQSDSTDYRGMLYHQSDSTDYRQLIDQHQDAFQAGNPFPDTFYDSICLQGKYHDVSEDTHWSEFINATVNYIRTKYPKPWSPETEKLVVFLLGFVSHDVADVSWHSLGIDQGFLQTMGKVNFYGSFEDAHDVGDIGGDIAALFEFNMDYIHSLTEWYIPVQDLIEIFQDFYAKKVITPTILEECAALMFLARFGERIAVGELYPLYSKKSPFLMEQYQSYFLGGVDDMAVWSQNIWHNTIHMIDHGMHDCDVPHNPLYIRCQNSSLALKDYERHPRRTHLYSRLQLGGLTLDDVIMKRTPKGVYLSPAKSLQDKLLNLEELKRNGGNVEAGDLTKPDATYSVKTPYTHLGWLYVNNNYQQGRVYIVYGKVTGLPLLDKDLNEQADVILEGIKYNGRFGSAILVMDLNVDGLNDLIVSAPSVNSESLMYTGEVYAFYGSNSGQLSKNPNITITCETKYCNLGHSLTSGDLNQDGFDDLVVGSPFAPMDGGNQRGMVNVLFSNTDLTGMSNCL